MRKSAKIVMGSVALVGLGALAWLISAKLEAPPPLSSLRGLKPYYYEKSRDIPQVGVVREASAVYHVHRPIEQVIAEVDRELVAGNGWTKGTFDTAAVLYTPFRVPEGPYTLGGRVFIVSGRKYPDGKPVCPARDRTAGGPPST